MELEQYIRDTAITRLLVRMALYRSPEVPLGAERVHAYLVTRHRNRQGDMMLAVQYDCEAEAICGQLSLIREYDALCFPSFTSQIARDWKLARAGGHSGPYQWDQQTEQMYSIIANGRQLLDPSNVLVVQHLSRILGALSNESLQIPDVHANRQSQGIRGVQTMLTRIQQVITNGLGDIAKFAAVG
jgi:hypothetical protein